MPAFTATYTTRSGQTRQLTVQAADPTAARRQLRQRGIVPQSLSAATAGKAGKAGQQGGQSSLLSMDLNQLMEAKPGVREKALFANKMASLVDAGVPIVRGLGLMAEQQKLPMFKRALEAVSRDVNQGESLGAAMRRWPKVFDKLTIAMVEAGETGGVLDETLRRLASLLEGNARLQNQIKGALGYPTAVLIIAILVFLGMTVFLIPTLTASAPSCLPSPR
jgi:type IV pilus assembly protein PilC